MDVNRDNTATLPTDPAVREVVTGIVARQLGVAPKYLRPSVGLQEYGADSHTFTSLQQGIEGHFGVTLSSRSLMEHRTVDALVTLVQTAIREQAGQVAAPAQDRSPPAVADIAPPALAHTGEQSASRAADHAGDHANQTVLKALEMLEAGQLQVDDVRRIADLLAAK